MKHRLYNLVGLLYLVFSLPPVAFLFMGKLANADPFYTVALGGVPLGVVFLLFGLKRVHINHMSNMALKFAIAALTFSIPLFLSYALIRAGYPIFENVVVLSALFIALASLNAFILALIALLHGQSRSSQASLLTRGHE